MGEKGSKKLLRWLKWLLEGITVGFGAILPGVSGGALCVSFGMYRPMIDTISNPRSGLKKYGWMLAIFVLGGAIGFVGLSGITAGLLAKNAVLVTCAFIGFIAGTIPGLWKDAGAQGRNYRSILALCLGFAGMLALLWLLKTDVDLTLSLGWPSFFFCGVLWGLSFIVPGLSSSSLLLFFGLYQPMLTGIATFDFSILIPMGIGAVLTVLLLSKVVELVYKRFYSVMSHALLGIVSATTVLLLPPWTGSFSKAAIDVLMIVACGVASYLFSSKSGLAEHHS